MKKNQILQAMQIINLITKYYDPNVSAFLFFHEKKRELKAKQEIEINFLIIFAP